MKASRVGCGVRTMTAKEYLSQYRKLNSEIDSLCEDLQRLRSLSTRTSSGQYSPGRKSGCSQEASFVKVTPKIIRLENKINRKTDELLIIQAEIEKAINSVQDGTLCALLRYRYICCLSWEKVAEKLNYSVDYVKGNLHGQALKNINTQ